MDLVETEVDPGLEQVTQTDEAAVKDGVCATVLGSRALGLPDGNGGRELTDTPSENETSNDELGDVERGDGYNWSVSRFCLCRKSGMD